jgi:hypothetical protein
VFDDVERRRLLVDPARKHPLELALRIAHVELHEGAGKLLHFPRRGGLAGAQPHDDIAGANRLAGVELDLARDAVALVEEAKHRHPLRHRRRAGRDGRYRLGDIDRLRLIRGLDVALRRARLFLLPTSGKRDEGGGQRAGADDMSDHAWSGVQAS